MSLFAKLLSTSGVIFAGRVVGAGAMFALQALIARLFGVDGLAEYSLAIAAANLCAAALPLGFQSIAAYFAGAYAARGQMDLLRSFLRQSFTQTCAMAALAAVGGYVLLPHRGGVAPLLLENWPQISVLALAFATVFVSGSAVVSLKKPVAGYLTEAAGRPLALAGGVGAAWLLQANADGLGILFWVFAAGAVVMAGIYLLLLRNAVQGVISPAGNGPGPETRGWWSYALPWMAIALATDFFFDLDLLLLSGLLDAKELAVFSVAARMFALVAFGVTAVYSVSLPDLFEADAAKDAARFKAKIAQTNLVAAGFSLLLAVGAAVFAPFAFLLFGPDFGQGTLPLVILCLGLTARCIFGPAPLVLSLHGRPSAPLPSVALGLAVLVIGNVVLVPPLGLTGAALSAFISITVWSTAMWVTAYRITGLDVSVLAFFRKDVS